MSFRTIGKPIETAEMSGTPTVAQSFTLDSTLRNRLLKGVVVGLCIEDPSMTALTLELWSDQGSAPSKLIAASTNSKTRSQLLGASANNYGFGWFGFTFTPVALKAGATYWLALRCTGYTYSASQHIAWRFSYPDPQYRDGITLNAAKAAKHPLECSLIMAEQ